jgi:hypothetical protein
MMTRIRFWGPLVGGLALSLGCGGSAVNPIGGGPKGGAGAGGADSNGVSGADSNDIGGADSNGVSGAPGAAGGVAGADPNCATGAVAGAPSDPACQVASTWSGYVENYHFADKSDAIKLVLDSKLAGHLTVGDSPAPAPPKDFDVGYPAALTPTPVPGGPLGVLVGLDPGFSFTLRSASLTGSFSNSRLQFDVSGSELSAVWCQHQTPYSDNQGHYTCVPNGYGVDNDGVCSTTDPVTMKDVPLDCGKLELCNLGSQCACTAKACAADPAVSLVHFDLRFDGAKFAGSAAGLDADLHNVYLTYNPQ